MLIVGLAISTALAGGSEIAPLPPTGDLFVTADVEGATVMLDGVEAGKTPFLLEHVPEGRHRVDVRTPCARGGQDVQVIQGVVTRAEVAIERGRGALDVTSVPLKAAVWIDGTDVGRSPVRVEVECGSRTVEVRCPGFLPASRTLFVPAFRTVPLEVALDVERFGRLSILPDPIGATVSLDGVVLGTGPWTLDAVSVGPHDLVVTSEGWQSDIRKVEVAPDGVTRVSVSLKRVRPEKKRMPWGRYALNTAPAAGGVVLGALALDSWLEAKAIYEEHRQVKDEAEANRIWNEEILPLRQRARTEAIVGGVLVAGSGVLWWRTSLKVGIGMGMVGVAGTW